MAQAQDLQPLPDLSSGFNLSAYAAQTDTIAKDFPGIDDASFQIALPKTWVERVALGQDYGEIAHFDGPAYGDVRPYFSFKRQAVARENTAKLELINYLLKNNYVLRSLREIDERNVEALYVLIDDHGDSYVVRAMMRINGPDMLLAEYAVPVNGWDDLRDAQTFAIKSFKFMKDSKEPIEKRMERTYFKSVRFFYPQSWFFVKEEAPADNIVVERLATKTQSGQDGGLINLTVASPKSLKDEAVLRVFPVDVPAMLRDIRKSYEDKGFIIEDAVETRKPALNLPTSFSTLQIYNMRTRTTQYDTDQKAPISAELWIAVFKGAGANSATYIAELFTPSRNLDLYAWSTNTRAFEIILKSIQ
jgi:hypothetical protein